MKDEYIAGCTVNDPQQLTPVVKIGDVWVKRDDGFQVNGVRGGKVRTCWHLAQGAKGLVTAGSRQSPQVNIVAHVAQALGIPCRVHTPQGALSPEVQDAIAAGAEVVQHPAGYNNVIIARAREDARKTGWREIPFGMECQEAIRQTRHQVRNLPLEIKRIVMPVGSGMSLAGVLHGLNDCGRLVPVLGVCVGADPTKRLDRFAPVKGGLTGVKTRLGWRDMVTLVQSPYDYHKPAPAPPLMGFLGSVNMDPIYEAKAREFVKEGDLFWIVGIRKTQGD